MHPTLRLRPRSLAGLSSLVVALLAAAALALSFGGSSPAYAVVGDCTPGSTWGTINTSFESQVLTLVNQHRTAMGLSALSTSPTLTNAAHWKSLHMAYYRYMTHDDPAPPVARTVSDRLAACGYPIGSVGWGENIAYGYATPQAVMDAWLNSPGHKANIENPSYRAIGIGAARNAGGVYYWTQDFGTLVDSAASPPPPTVSAPTVSLTATPSSSTTSTSASFAWTTTNSPTSTSCSLDGAAATSCSSPQSYSSLAAGSHRFVVTVANSGGSNSASYGWTVTSTSPPPTTATFDTLSARHSGQCLDVSGSSGAAGAGVVQFTCNGADAEKWQLVSAGGGYYNLVVKSTGYCLDVSGASQTPGATALQWPCNGGANQQWQIVATDSGYSTLVARHSGQCLDVFYASQASGATVGQYTCNGGTNQQWLLTPAG